MEQISSEETFKEIRKSGIVNICKKITPKKRVGVIGFKESSDLLIEKTYIFYIPEVFPEEVNRYCEELDVYFGKPLKDFNEEIFLKKNELKDYFPLLSKLNESPGRKEAFYGRKGDLSELAEKIIRQQKENSPLIDWQCLYGRKSEDITKIEIVRICPYYYENLSLVEYAISSITENSANKSQIVN